MALSPMADDDWPVFRPRFGLKRVPPHDRSLRAGVLAGASSAARRLRSAARRAQPHRVDTRAPTAQSRRVVVKARFVKLTAHGAAAAVLHLRYIQRDGVERDGSPGILYGPTGEVAAAVFEQPRVGEQHQFRFIVSPEDAGELELTEYVRRLMHQVEKDVGRPIEWAAVNHYNTDHPHAHVVVRGVDRDGRALRFDSGYMARGFRERAQELATQELGPRTPEEIQRARHREITQERVTSLDQELDRRNQAGPLTRAALEKSGRAGAAAPPLLARLEHLERLGLAERAAPDAWRLTPGWKERLRELGERNDIIRQMHAAVGGDTARYRTVKPGEALDPEASRDRPAPPIAGRIRAKALADEVRGTYCAIVEAPDGCAYRLPLDPRTAASCRVGEFVTVASVPRSRSRPENPALEAMARAGGGVCTLSTSHPAHRPLAQRLRQLEALGLAHREGPDAWRMEPALAKALERLDAQRPDFRLVLRSDGRTAPQQVVARGPVWLDRIDAGSLAGYGLGAEVADFREQRARALRSFGIDPADPRRLPKLRELERLTVGQRAATLEDAAFLPKTPDRFQGRVVAPTDAPAYALVSDGQQLVVLPMTRELRGHIGQRVVLERDPSGKLRVAPAHLDRGG